tara:strand:+ start:3921 stop:4880 length:960 start_codon:yes stop_codon:yes gene_type:complete
MATKITANKTKKIDITARRGDDFIVQLDIRDDENNLIYFQQDSYTLAKYILEATYPISRQQKLGFLAAEDLMLFTITTSDGNPVLAACSSDLDLAMPDKNIDPTTHLYNPLASIIAGEGVNEGYYVNPTTQRQFDKLYNEFHILKIIALSKILSKASTKNTEEENSNYNLDNLIFTPSRIYDQNQNPIYTSPKINDWLYNIFTNTDVVKESMVEQHIIANRDYNLWNLSYEDNRYIFWGKVEGNNSFTIKFPYDKFNLPKGTYNYSFKSLSNYTSLGYGQNYITNPLYAGESIIKGEDSINLQFADVTTWIEGKLKIIE